MTDSTQQHEGAELDQEHDELTAMISELRSWLAEVAELGIPRFGELSSRLQPLCQKLSEHFDHEEQNGYLEAAVAAKPDLSAKVHELLSQHEQFSNDLAALISRLRDSETPFDSWQTACEKFEDLCAAVAQHEESEMALRDEPAATGSPPKK